MNCKFHDKESVSKCKFCGAELCEECKKFEDKFGHCPKCAKKEIEKMYGNIKNGLIYNIVGLTAAVAFVVMYVVCLCLGQLGKDFIVIGAIIIALLLPLSIIMLVYSLNNLKKYKYYLKVIKD